MRGRRGQRLKERLSFFSNFRRPARAGGLAGLECGLEHRPAPPRAQGGESLNKKNKNAYFVPEKPEELPVEAALLDTEAANLFVFFGPY